VNFGRKILTTINPLKILNQTKERKNKMKVEYSENNSGGSWWLEKEQYKSLEEAGWKVEGRTATKEFDSVAAAKKEWQDVTGGYPDEMGCNCCGRPHRFMETDEEESEG